MLFSKHFIGAANELCDYDAPVPAPYLRKTFTLDFQPECGEIVICGLGFYELYINSQRVSKGELAPYISDPDHVCYYDSFNISGYLKKGKNCIGILLGNGMRNAYGGDCWDFHKADFRGPVAAALSFCARGEGRELSFEADESFKTHPSPIIYNDLRMGYKYDSRLNIPDWCEPEFDDSCWRAATSIPAPKGEARLCEADPVRVIEVRLAEKITHYDELPYAYADTASGSEPHPDAVRRDVYLYDFGVNSAGVTVLKINGKPGQTVTVRHGDYFVNGRFNINNIINRHEHLIDRSVKYLQSDVFICRGGYEEFVPRFKYDGFRYAYVEGLFPEQAVKEALEFRVMSSIGERRAYFKCSDDRLNKLYDITLRSDIANFYYFPTDCPHREKNGWTGDASLSAEQLLLNFKVAPSLKEWLRNIRYAQREDGALPGIVPTGGWGFKWGNGPAWDAVAVDIPYYIYKYDGDTDVIRDNADMIVRYLKYAETRLDERGLAAYGLGDWNAPDMKMTAPLIVTDSIRLYETASKASELFDIAGLDTEHAVALGFAEKMREAIRKHLVDESCLVLGNCQTSQCYALEAGIFNDDQLSAARARLVEIVIRDGEGEVNTCGIIGMRHILHALTEAGESELAYKLVTSTHHTCYGYWLANGATTLWENFKPIDHRYIDSFDHHYFGDVSSWMIRDIVGLKFAEFIDARSLYVVKPQFITCISEAEAGYDTDGGRFGAAWKRVDGGVRIDITIPEGGMGKLILPFGYRFENGEREMLIEETSRLTVTAISFER